MSKIIVGMGGKRHLVEDDGTCPWYPRDRKLTLIAVATCKTCGACWTGTDYDHLRTH